MNRVRKAALLAAMMSSYVEGGSSFLQLSGNTIRYNLKQQDPEEVLAYAVL